MVNFEHYRWQNHAIPRGRWRSDFAVAIAFLAMLAGACLGPQTGDARAGASATALTSPPAHPADGSRG